MKNSQVKRGKIDPALLDEQGLQLSLFSDDSETTPETDASESEVSIKFAFPVIMFTYPFLQLCRNHKLARIPTTLALCMLGNMDAERGFIHKFKVKNRAKEIGCTKAQIYIAIRQLRKIGFANLKLRYGTVSGRILAKDMLPKCVMDQYESGKLTDADLAGNAMSVGMIHHAELETHIKTRTTGAHLRLMMACCLNIDVQTGELHEKRPIEWADLAAIDRTWASEGFARANRNGCIQTQTDYDVKGRMPFVALANGVFQNAKLAKEQGRRNPENWFKEKCIALYEAFGIQLTGLAHEIIENAWKLLGEEADKIIKKSIRKTEELMEKKLEVNYQRQRIVQNADPHTIPLREVLPFA